MHYLATVLKADDTVVPMSRLMTIDVLEDPRDAANAGKRTFMHIILSELEEGDLITWVQGNYIDLPNGAEDIIL